MEQKKVKITERKQEVLKALKTLAPIFTIN